MPTKRLHGTAFSSPRRGKKLFPCRRWRKEVDCWKSRVSPNLLEIGAIKLTDPPVQGQGSTHTMLLFKCLYNLLMPELSVMVSWIVGQWLKQCWLSRFFPDWKCCRAKTNSNLIRVLIALMIRCGRDVWKSLPLKIRGNLLLSTVVTIPEIEEGCAGGDLNSCPCLARASYSILLLTMVTLKMLQMFSCCIIRNLESFSYLTKARITCNLHRDLNII